ncbi:MAG TPA: alkaline phosphatase D family protein [Gemmatimonadales bacterium]|nr:alkaline phosphatase D family protein [Gemmatimonadales bacterium]
MTARAGRLPGPGPLDRRGFLEQLSGFSLALAGVPLARRWTRPAFGADPFTLGVASGDPAPDGFVLWTRLAPDPWRGGGMRPERVAVGWELAADEGMRRIVRRGTADAAPELGHSVHVEIGGLAPDRWYFYRFHAGGAVSPVGRARTVPAAAVPASRMRFAFASCQHYEQGLYTAYRHMAAEELDLVVHLGDYIYEYEGRLDRARMHTGTELESLDDYRNRYALYKTDPDLQAAHAAFPWVVTWDDHEVSNNYAGAVSARNDPAEAFLRRRAAAYQAYYEHMPLRRTSLPRGADLRLYRSLRFGRLASIHMLDTRQYRDDQVCGDGVKPACPDALDPARTVLGAAQERWLTGQLTGSPGGWNVLGQQILMASMPESGEEGQPPRFGMDNWNGYQGARQRLLDFLAARGKGDTVVLTGDIHTSFAADLKQRFDDSAAPAIAVEFVGTSISSGGDGMEEWPSWPRIAPNAPHIRYHCARRGYVRCEVTPDRWRSDYRLLPFVVQPDAPVETRASFVTAFGRPGLERA